MTNLLTILPDFDIDAHASVFPALEKGLITTADILTLDALDIAKRAQVPVEEVRRLVGLVLNNLHSSLSYTALEPLQDDRPDHAATGASGCASGTFLSTLDDSLDLALNGGIANGYLTEIVGESAVGKTQLLLTLLLSAQLPRPNGPGKSVLYISTESPLQTTRLQQILDKHPRLTSLPEDQRPNLSRIHSTRIHDVEAQEHVLRYQVPVAIEKQNIGLLVIDSIAANYRAEFDKGASQQGAASFARRSAQIVQMGALLRNLAQVHGIAVVVANQVADRFTTIESSSQSINGSQKHLHSRPTTPARGNNSSPALGQTKAANEAKTSYTALSTDDPLSLDHQQRFFTGWGDDSMAVDLKTPSLGLTWSNQLAARIALHKDPIYEVRNYQMGEEKSICGWDRHLKVVFSAWCAEGVVPFEIAESGLRSCSDQRVSEP